MPKSQKKKHIYTKKDYLGIQNIYGRIYMKPDIFVIHDGSRQAERGCIGTPGSIIGTPSSSTPQYGHDVKLFKYRPATVREYRIVSPHKQTVPSADKGHTVLHHR
ncbi:MAG: hypothetical protein HFE84_12210 [Lachnospiraceae bacterium]|jgi:hypothetical protein|nr:hypothetical protein [Lachnospiraceae bacterium]